MFVFGVFGSVLLRLVYYAPDRFNGLPCRFGPLERNPGCVCVRARVFIYVQVDWSVDWLEKIPGSI